MTVCVDRSVYTLTVFKTTVVQHYVHEPGLVLPVLNSFIPGHF